MVSDARHCIRCGCGECRASRKGDGSMSSTSQDVCECLECAGTLCSDGPRRTSSAAELDIIEEERDRVIKKQRTFIIQLKSRISAIEATEQGQRALVHGLNTRITGLEKEVLNKAKAVRVKGEELKDTGRELAWIQFKGHRPTLEQQERAWTTSQDDIISLYKQSEGFDPTTLQFPAPVIYLPMAARSIEWDELYQLYGILDKSATPSAILLGTRYPLLPTMEIIFVERIIPFRAIRELITRLAHVVYPGEPKVLPVPIVGPRLHSRDFEKIHIGDHALLADSWLALGPRQQEGSQIDIVGIIQVTEETLFPYQVCCATKRVLVYCMRDQWTSEDVSKVFKPSLKQWLRESGGEDRVEAWTFEPEEICRVRSIPLANLLAVYYVHCALSQQAFNLPKHLDNTIDEDAVHNFLTFQYARELYREVKRSGRAFKAIVGAGA